MRYYSNRFTTLCISILLLLSVEARAATHIGVGYSTLTAGRRVPALELGLAVNDKWLVSGMLAGVQTKAYYASGFMINALRVADWGEFWFGHLEVGFGGGAYHGEKGVYTSIDDNGKFSNLKKDKDNLVGPAFRVAFLPFAHTHISVEFIMGIGESIFSNAWGDAGICGIGVDL